MATATKKTKEDAPDRVICLIEGESGNGKSFFLANIPDSVIYDVDLGGGLAYLDARIKKNGSEREELYSYKDVLDDLRKRAAEGRLKKNIAIDHVTGLHQAAVLKYNPSQESDYGRSGNRATYDWRSIREFARTFDCNLWVIAHLKAEYEKDKQVGKTADGAKNIEADMHIVLRLENKKENKTYPSVAHVVKWRRDPEDPRGAVPASFPFSVEEFSKIFGADFQRKRKDVAFAKPETVAEVSRVLEFLGEDRKAELKAKWFSAAGVEKFEQMTEEQIQACLAFLQKEMGVAK